MENKFIEIKILDLQNFHNLTIKTNIKNDIFIVDILEYAIKCIKNEA